MKSKIFCVSVAILTSLAVTLDAAAVPFFSQRARGTLNQALAESGTQTGLMTGYTEDVQSGVGDFVFLARNFAGGNAASNGKSPNGLIGPAVDPIVVVTPAPMPGSLPLLALGGALLLWSRRQGQIAAAPRN